VTESQYTAAINQAVRRHPPAYAWKISDRFTAGIPDAYYSGNNGDLWVEYKWLGKPTKALPKPALSELQKDWLLNQHRNGRNVAVIVGTPERSVIYPKDTWHKDPDSSIIVQNKKDVVQWIIHQILQAP
jgi:hypothetical protein